MPGLEELPTVTADAMTSRIAAALGRGCPIRLAVPGVGSLSIGPDGRIDSMAVDDRALLADIENFDLAFDAALRTARAGRRFRDVCGGAMRTEAAAWQPIAAEGVEVETAIIDAEGQRNTQTLVRKGRLWFRRVAAGYGWAYLYDGSHPTTSTIADARANADAAVIEAGIVDEETIRRHRANEEER